MMPVTSLLCSPRDVFLMDVDRIHSELDKRRKDPAISEQERDYATEAWGFLGGWKYDVDHIKQSDSVCWDRLLNPKLILDLGATLDPLNMTAQNFVDVFITPLAMPLPVPKVMMPLQFRFITKMSFEDAPILGEPLPGPSSTTNVSEADRSPRIEALCITPIKSSFEVLGIPPDGRKNVVEPQKDGTWKKPDCVFVVGPIPLWRQEHKKEASLLPEATSQLAASRAKYQEFPVIASTASGTVAQLYYHSSDSFEPLRHGDKDLSFKDLELPGQRLELFVFQLNWSMFIVYLFLPALLKERGGYFFESTDKEKGRFQLIIISDSPDWKNSFSKQSSSSIKKEVPSPMLDQEPEQPTYVTKMVSNIGDKSPGTRHDINAIKNCYDVLKECKNPSLLQIESFDEGVYGHDFDLPTLTHPKEFLGRGYFSVCMEYLPYPGVPRDTNEFFLASIAVAECLIVLHENNLCHCDVRWPNVRCWRDTPSAKATRFCLIDFEFARQNGRPAPKLKHYKECGERCGKNCSPADDIYFAILMFEKVFELLPVALVLGLPLTPNDSGKWKKGPSFKEYLFGAGTAEELKKRLTEKKEQEENRFSVSHASI